jgi:hypothetical protein
MKLKDLGKDNIQILVNLWEASDANSEIKTELSDYFQDQIHSNPRCSKEDILYYISNRGQIIIHFFPTSLAYDKYGKYILVNRILENDEVLNNLWNNIKNHKLTVGPIKLQSVKDNTTIIIDTKEVYDIIC